ncbi:MAG: glycosyltransferase [Elusimicrobia bacterium]|nr:glycosyltransferase [Elusimicrobiota bacterium]
MTAPRITVLMAVRDGERHLREALASLTAQTLTDLEILVIDDGSSDRTAAILADRPDARLIVVRQAPQGLTRALSRGLAMVRTPYVARMDADDVAEPGRLARQVALLDARPSVGLCGAWARIVDEQGRTLDRARPPIDHPAIAAQLLWDNAFVHATWVFRTDVIRAAGGYEERVERAQDYELATRLARLTELANIPEALLRWRRSSSGVSVRHLRDQRRSVAETSYRALTAALGAPPERGWFERMRGLWDGTRATLDRGDGQKLADLIAGLPVAAGRTVFVRLAVMVAAARIGEAASILAAAWQRFPDARGRLASPGTLLSIASGSVGIRAQRRLRRTLRGY